MEAYTDFRQRSWVKLKKLATPTISDIYGISDKTIQLCLFVFYGYIDELKKFSFEEMNIAINRNKDNLYILAAYGGHIEIMKYLEEKGFDIHVVNQLGTNAYLIAAYGGQIETMEYLEKKGFDIYVEDDSGNNAYLIAAKGGHNDALIYLEEKGINIYSENGGYCNALRLHHLRDTAI